MKQIIWLMSLALVGTSVQAADSICFGTASRGRLEGRIALPAYGKNFKPYSELGVMLGRTFVHSRVERVIVAAYQQLERTLPDRTYLYAESGWKAGGRIRPHRTHQNGTAVDFLVPVKDGSGNPAVLATGVTNKFGYAYEFDDDAKAEGYTIDFDAIAAHLLALNSAAQKEGIGLARVILGPRFLPKLFAAKGGAEVKAMVPFMKGNPWIRHDEHYHVDFALKCSPYES